MRNLLTLSVFVVVFTSCLFAQNPLERDAISLKYTFLDYKGPADGGDIADFSNYTNGLEFSYSRNILPFLNLNMPLGFSTVQFKDSLAKEVTIDFGVQGQLQYWRRSNVVTPYFLAGANAVYETNSNEFGVVFPIGIGADFRISKSVAINLQLEYRISTDDNRSNIHNGIGLKYFIGNKDKDEMEELINDTDGDGVPDETDLCPDVPGTLEMQGCPDTDGDGLVDYDDECPNEYGIASLGGCPDSDNDGVVDSKDDCPNDPGPVENNGCPGNDSDGDGVPDQVDECPGTPGLTSLNGCPDSDGDGVKDSDDACPQAAGTLANRGCPDSDGDGIHDGIDLCPGTFGTAANNGCPEITREIREVLEFAMSAVQFETGKATLKTESKIVLDQVVEIMKNNPTFNLNISGHTDAVGDALKNLDLSERRAKSCYSYLIVNGISPDRLSYVGYGETRPIASNNTSTGKLKNRRVEFEVKFK